MKKYKPLLILLIGSLFLFNCSQNYKNNSVEIEEKIRTKISDSGRKLLFQIKPGKYHNHPTFAIWIEDMEGNYLAPLYVTKSVSSGIWPHGELAPGKWKDEPGKAVRAAALPYWFHKRSDGMTPAIPNENDVIPDAITSATPSAGFYLETQSAVENQKFRVVMEVNQTWDWNEFWHNNKFSDNQDYKTSCQPALVYAVIIDPNSEIKEYYLNPIGHSHYSGENGMLYTDLSTFTTALKIFDRIKVIVK